jgi:hypothetical protein
MEIAVKKAAGNPEKISCGLSVCMPQTAVQSNP